MRIPALIVVLAAVALGGCGDATLSSSSVDELHAQVAAVRDAAEKGDRAGALKALDGLEATVRDLEAGGSLAQADADALRRGIGRARRRARAEIAEPTPEPTPAPAATPEPTATPAPAQPQGKPANPPKGKGKGKKGKH